MRSFDWILVIGLAALVVVGLWGIGGVTSHDVAGDPHYYLNRQILYAAVGGLVLVAAALVDPDLYRRYWRLIFGGIVGLIRSSISSARRRTARRAGSTSASSVPAVRVREAPRRPRARRADRRAAGSAIGEWSDDADGAAFGAVPTLLVFIQPDLGTALVYMAAIAAMLFVAGTPWTHLATLGAIAVLLIVGVLGWGRR